MRDIPKTAAKVTITSPQTCEFGIFYCSNQFCDESRPDIFYGLCVLKLFIYLFIYFCRSLWKYTMGYQWAISEFAVSLIMKARTWTRFVSPREWTPPSPPTKPMFSRKPLGSEAFFRSLLSKVFLLRDNLVTCHRAPNQ